jgi:hypothetical protein
MKTSQMKIEKHRTKSTQGVGQNVKKTEKKKMRNAENIVNDEKEMNLLLPKKKGTQIEDNSTKKQRKHNATKREEYTKNGRMNLFPQKRKGMQSADRSTQNNN